MYINDCEPTKQTNKQTNKHIHNHQVPNHIQIKLLSRSLALVGFGYGSSSALVPIATLFNTDNCCLSFCFICMEQYIKSVTKYEMDKRDRGEDLKASTKSLLSRSHFLMVIIVIAIVIVACIRHR